MGEEFCKNNPGICWPKPLPCCRANNAECNACSAKVSEEEYCKKNQHVSGCEKYKICCTANNAECNACAADLTEEQYCEKNPAIQGCDKYHKKSCCKANNAECNACALDMTEEEYCNFHPYVSGCEKYKICCRAHDAKCLACAADQTEEQYCKRNQHVPGCEKYRDDGHGGVDFGGKKGCCKGNTSARRGGTETPPVARETARRTGATSGTGRADAILVYLRIRGTPLEFLFGQVFWGSFQVYIFQFYITHDNSCHL